MIERAPLRSQVHRAIIDLIRAEGLGAGDRLPSTAALTERFEVSRPVVREALSALHAIGVIEVANGRNATVRAVDSHLVGLYLSLATSGSASDLLALLEVRAPLEVQAASLAAHRRRPTEGRALAARAASMATALDDPRAYVELDVAFHREIAALSANPVLLTFVDAVRDQVTEAMVRLRMHRERTGLVGPEQAEHEAIAAAIASGDASEAEALMRTHMDHANELAATAWSTVEREDAA